VSTYRQASKDVKLSIVSRALMEPKPLTKTKDRLSLNRGDKDLTCTINNHNSDWQMKRLITPWLLWKHWI